MDKATLHYLLQPGTSQLHSNVCERVSVNVRKLCHTFVCSQVLQSDRRKQIVAARPHTHEHTHTIASPLHRLNGRWEVPGWGVEGGVSPQQQRLCKRSERRNEEKHGTGDLPDKHTQTHAHTERESFELKLSLLSSWESHNTDTRFPADTENLAMLVCVCMYACVRSIYQPVSVSEWKLHNKPHSLHCAHAHTQS